MPQASGTTRVHTGSHWGVYHADIKQGRLASVTPHAQDPHPTPLLEAFPSALYHETRIAQPMVRQGYLEHGPDSDRAGRGVEPFVPVSWEQALDLIANELARVQRTYGNEAIFASSGWASAGIFHHAGSQLFRFLNGFGGYISQVTNWSFGAASVIVPHVVGSMEPVTRLTAWPTLRDHTKLLVMFGGMAPKNLQVQNGGLVQHRTMDWLQQLQQAGVACVNISPMRSDAADLLGAQWLPIRPNTDTALMLGLAHTLLAEGLHDEAFLARYCVGFERFRSYLLGTTDGQPKDAAWAATITDLPANTIRQLARHMAAVRTMITVSWSIQRADHGEQPYWAAITLAAMLGQIGLPGGGVGFGYGATGGLGNAAARMPQPKLPTGTNRVKTFVPVARFADMLLNPGAAYDFNGQRLTYPDVRLVYWCGGNPFHKVQDLNKLLRAWQRPETIIIHEPWWTPAARRADIVLPCATTLERNDIGVSMFDGCYFAMQQAVAPVGDARSDYEVYSALATRLGFAEQFTEGRSEMDWVRHLYAEARQQAAQQQLELPPFEALWEAGTVNVPLPEHPPVLFGAFRQDPDANPLGTPSGRIEIFSKTIDSFGYDDCPGHPTWLEPAEWLGSAQTAQYPLHLLSNQPSARLHSQLDCSSLSRNAKVAGREALWLHPEDAAARGIRDGEVVRVYNARGACLAGAVVTEAIRPGVVQLATGAWFDPLDPAAPGSLDKHGNPNVLTLDKGTSKLGQCSSAQTVLVEVARVTETPPALSIFTPPAVLAS
ncbi:MAG: molybdopterin guanine dinucleotide-containing S/N-oxide reductase [Candidatus Tectomicrobia bacterium]|uniref:Molybdopterin guanine dinucleotide-containing S/N-oxide reductase n=1 Tax=Tectimicrobiota bacterium TaxID=2528274 RepID=A0A937W159_UNCTE|nr:molybdopterin guanine dinucleotide-containing S/N-oxide reductase [Candidatus Tectomicrobia bacterium]